MHRAKLWFDHVDDYMEVCQKMHDNPYVKAGMKDDPGVKFMHKGATIFWICWIIVHGLLCWACGV